MLNSKIYSNDPSSTENNNILIGQFQITLPIIKLKILKKCTINKTKYVSLAKTIILYFFHEIFLNIIMDYYILLL